MTRALIAIAVFTFSIGTGLNAQTPLDLRPVQPDTPDMPCEHHPGSPTSCSRFIGCLGDQGAYFQGYSRGWNSGTLTARTSEGANCTGTWKYANMFGIPQADIFCDNGEGGRLFFFYQDSITGTARGKGRSNKGRIVEMWSGENLKQFFTTAEPDREFPVMHCGPADVPIS